MMDDDSCVMNYIEIVPVSDVRDCSEFTDVEQEPVHVKVWIYRTFNIVSMLYIVFVNSFIFGFIFSSVSAFKHINV